MSKRTPGLERKPRDFYPTPSAGAIPLFPFLKTGASFYEPCCGDGDLVTHLVAKGGFICRGMSDINPEGFWVKDALELTEAYVAESDYIITNPPWDRKLLHPMITHFRSLRPTWLLLDADWMHTKQAAEYMKYCAKVVSVGRLKWIPDSKMTGKDNCAWFLFVRDETQTVFVGR